MKKKIFTGLILALIVCSIVCLTACGGINLNTTYDLYKRTKSENFVLLNETATKGQVVMIGDSIVELFPTELYENFEKKVYGRGISGDTSDRMLERIESNALAIIAPTVLSILVGTNDITRGFSNDEIAENIKKSVIKAKEAGVKQIIVQSVYPVKGGTLVRGKSKKILVMELNEQLKGICTELGAVYVDVHSALKDDNGNFTKKYTYDDLHPNAAGYKVIAEVLRPYFVV